MVANTSAWLVALHTWGVTSTWRTEARSVCSSGGEKQSEQEGEGSRGRMQT